MFRCASESCGEPAFDKFVRSKSKLPGQTPYLLATDVPPPPGGDRAGKEFAEVASYENLVATICDPVNWYKNLYEIVRSMDEPVFGMFDIDRHDSVYSPLAIFNAFAAAFSKFMDTIHMDIVLVPGETCQVADSTTAARTSLHIIATCR